jgi:myo-inositol 2-dehydrogenase/D-chiro-inositol 1-dehydrogenase
MRVLVVGCGAMGRIHGDALRRRGVDISCTDVDVEASRRLADALGASVTGLEPDGIDAAVVTTPAPTHAPLVSTLIAAGVPAFCEKPLALTLEETRTVGELADARSVPLQIGFHRRCDAGYRRVRDAVRDGELGRVQLVRASTHTAGQPVDASLGGSILRDLQIHDFDAVRFVTGAEPTAVSAFAVDPVAPAGPSWNSPAVVSVLEMSDGSVAVVTGGRPSPPGYDARIEVSGSAGSVATGLEPGFQRFLDRFADAYEAEMDAFLALVDGGQNPCGWRDSYAAMAVAIAAERSAQERAASVPISVH